MKIQIDHIGKIEGHAGFLAHVVNQDFKKAKIEIQEGARLIEGLLLNRPFQDIPDITSRICGICPTVHNITASKALEKAFKFEPSLEIELMRRILLYAQIIHSHSLHLYFLSLPDFFEEKNSLKFSRKSPSATKLALKIRAFAAKIIETIGGRTIHPMNLTVGGFKSLPKISALKNLLKESERMLSESERFAEIFTFIQFSEYQRKTAFVSLWEKNYPLFNSSFISLNEKKIPLEKAYLTIEEEHLPSHFEKRAKIQNQTVMVGALARINNHKNALSQHAKKLLNFETPNFNTFLNIPAQAIEIVHANEIILQNLKKYLQKPLKKNIPVTPKKGRGLAASEAPRGTLFHYYETDAHGFIIKANIIAPTGIFLNNLEADCQNYLKNLDPNLPAGKIKDLIRTFIRAYDPCIACATH
jgi:coenzyme F420-reducing hydrogenase alpha subunit